jgi:hypothetical protein
MQNEKRRERSDKKIRVNAGVDKDTHEKLEKLAFVVDVPKTILAGVLIELSVNNSKIIDHIQKIYRVKDDQGLFRWLKTERSVTFGLQRQFRHRFNE